jgi:CheY-like chemotaxis protein
MKSPPPSDCFSDAVKEARRTAMRILLVDDEPALRELLRATLEGADVTVDEAESGAEAESRIRRQRPDVIVLDLRMPGMSGAELCVRL